MMKMILYKTLVGFKSRNSPVWLLLLMLTITGCKKDKPSAPIKARDGNTINLVLNDNFSTSIVYAGLQYAALDDTLSKPGPYTFLAPVNNAFFTLGIYNYNSFASLGARVQNIMRYSILNGKNSFKSLPFIQNKPFLTLTDGNIYVSKYLSGTDTVTTVNGVKISSLDNPASNGLIQVISQVLNPEIYHHAVDYIHNDTTLTMFSAALQRSGLDVSLLAGDEDYTLLAPSNTAFYQSGSLGQNLGLSKLDSILGADPAKLATFLKYHIIKGLYFEGDLYNQANTDTTGIAMMSGGKVMIGGNQAGFHAITFLGSGNNSIASQIAVSSDQTIINANIPCGNAVIHIVNQVLIP